jgi:hypothetical protein
MPAQFIDDLPEIPKPWASIRALQNAAEIAQVRAIVNGDDAAAAVELVTARNYSSFIGSARALLAADDVLSTRASQFLTDLFDAASLDVVTREVTAFHRAAVDPHYVEFLMDYCARCIRVGTHASDAQFRSLWPELVAFSKSATRELRIAGADRSQAADVLNRIALTGIRRGVPRSNIGIASLALQQAMTTCTVDTFAALTSREALAVLAVAAPIDTFRSVCMGLKSAAAADGSDGPPRDFSIAIVNISESVAQSRIDADDFPRARIALNVALETEASLIVAEPGRPRDQFTNLRGISDALAASGKAFSPDFER